MRILIVGAGVAGLTLAALLQRQSSDVRPEVVVVERHRNPGHGATVGYALALWPHGTRVFHGLGIHHDFITHSEPMRRYVAQDGDGDVLTASPLPPSISAYGPVGLVPRSDLIGLLRSAADDATIRDGISIDALHSRGDRVEARLSDGTETNFDLVIGADGIRSRVRDLTWGAVPGHDTGWRCLVWWADRSLAGPGETIERYGTGSFLGTYPCRDRLCVIAGAPADVIDDTTPQEDRVNQVTDLLSQYAVPVDDLLAGLPRADGAGLVWRMADVRAPRWVRGRVALVGDAAAGFLPTAGIGASMALESAAVLADELSRTDTRYLPKALELYERRRRRRVEAAQTQSRRLARLMFLRSPVLSRLRNRAIRHTRMEQLVGPLITDLRRPI